MDLQTGSWGRLRKWVYHSLISWPPLPWPSSCRMQCMTSVRDLEAFQSYRKSSKKALRLIPMTPI
jgi:hypothetical protein